MAGYGNPRMSQTPSNIKVITIAAPAAGAELSQVVPLGKTWRLMSWIATFTASATVATRQALMIIDDGTNTLSRVPSATTITAAQAVIVQGFSGPGLFGNITAVQTSPILLPNPQFFVLQPGWRVRTSVINLDAGDQWSTCYMVVDEIDVAYPTT